MLTVVRVRACRDGIGFFPECVRYTVESGSVQDNTYVNCFVVWIVYLIVFFGLPVDGRGGD